MTTSSLPLPELPREGATRVLIADDEPALLRAYGRTLEMSGFSVATANDGREAEAQLAAGSFDVIVSDISMPGMTGIELLRSVRARDLDVPVLLVTADARLDTAMEAVRYGALRYLSKPVDLDELRAEVERAAALSRMARAKRTALTLLGEKYRALGDRAALESRFTLALEGVWMAYQPIVSWSERRLYSYEALVRSNESTLPHPGALFDAAERLDSLTALGRTIRRAVAASAAEAPLVFVNLHTRDLLDETLFTPSDPLAPMAERVVLEITERAALDELHDVPRRIQALRRMGYRIALDDLGAGYAGLSSFAQLQPDIVKLDMSLVRRIEEDGTRQRLVKSMLDVCHDLRIGVVAEGIETEAERDTLVTLGADLFQGYLFARPGRPLPPFRL